jgi:MFS family permease
VPAALTRSAGLREARFRKLLVGYGASMLGNAMAPVALSFALLDAGRSAGQLGWVLAVYALAAAVSLPVGGVAADRLGRRKTMIVGDLLGAASQLTLAPLLLRGDAELWMYLALMAINGCGQALYGPAMAGLIPEIAGGAGLQQANALIGVVTSAGSIAGPAIAGAAAATVGPGWAILANGLSYVVSAACLARLGGLGTATTGESLLRQLRTGWQVFRELDWLWPVSAYDAVGSLLIFAPYAVLGAVVAKASLGGAGAWGAILAGEGAGAVLGSLVCLWVKPVRPLVAAMIGRIALLAPLLLLILRAPVPIIVAGGCLAGAGFEFFQTLWGTTVQRLVPAGSLSRVTAFDWVCVMALAPAGYGLVGMLAAVLGVNGTLWLAASAVAVLSVTVACLPAIRAVRAPDQAG